MATVEEVQAELEAINETVANVSGDVDSLLVQIAALKEEIANGGVATQEEIDALHSLATSIKASLQAVDEKEPAA